MRIKTETKRQAIINVARQAFDEAGFEATSMSSIATRMGGSKGTLYSYFASKEELFVAVVRQIGESHMQTIFSGLDPQQDLQSSLQRFGERMLGAICLPEIIHAYRNIMAESGKSEVGRLFLASGPQEGKRQVVAYLQACMDLGKLQRADSAVAAEHLIALLKSEVHEPLLFGARAPFSAAEIKAIVARALSAFLAAYGAKPNS